MEELIVLRKDALSKHMQMNTTPNTKRLTYWHNQWNLQNDKLIELNKIELTNSIELKRKRMIKLINLFIWHDGAIISVQIKVENHKNKKSSQLRMRKQVVWK